MSSGRPRKSLTKPFRPTTLRSAPSGSLTILYFCNAHTDQEWIPESNGALLNLKSGRCLDDPSDSTTNGTQQQIWNCNTNPQQNWTLP
jgi:hypothetical protein